MGCRKKEENATRNAVCLNDKFDVSVVKVEGLVFKNDVITYVQYGKDDV
jgi:hypothetical protein